LISTIEIERVHHPIPEAKFSQDYFDTRNGMIGADFSTKFSPWLAIGKPPF
jgi:deoxyribodipyrimidine photo-lyase